MRVRSSSCDRQTPSSKVSEPPGESRLARRSHRGHGLGRDPTMRTLIKLGLFACAFAACGHDPSTSPDTHTGNSPPPRIIPGGGIGDGAIDGVVNFYVLDDATQTPIANAAVRVGTLDGTTDATGLFVAQ